MQVREVMTSPVTTVGPEAPPAVAATLLAEHGFTALPVVDGDGELVGIVTEADLLRGRVHHDPRSPLLSDELGAGLPPATVEEVMTADVLTTTPWADVADLVERMRFRRIRSVPVVETGRQVVGIVSRRDVLETFTHADERVVRDVRNRLENYARPGRWGVEVHDGVVTLRDPFEDEAERHTASLIAASVHGVVGVQVAPASA